MMPHRLRLPRTLLLLALGCKSPEEPKDSGPTYAREFSIVHVRAADNVATQLAVHACAGIENRRLGGSIFVQTDVDVPQASIDGALVQDELWLPELGLAAAAEMESGPFLQSCLEKAGGCLRYSYASQQEILPAILTVAAAKGLPPLADEGGLTCKNPKVDALSLFAGKDSQLLSTQVAMEEVLSSTSGLAMLNPGYDRNAEDPADPEIIDDMPVALIDFVFSRKLFVTFLVNGCIEENPERELLSRIVNESGWPTPVGVFGYNDSWLVGGYLYEAQTRCLESANMGAIPTRTTNLSFFDTRRPAIQTPEELSLTAPEDVNYDPSKTYVAFVIGDGDNIRYIMSTRKDWLQQRLERCGGGGCPPLSWTISPHLSDMAPDVLEWYAKSAHATGSDYFILPPSGYQYAYPGRMPADVQARFVTGTEKAAKILGTHSTVHWEWLDGWDAAVQGFLPRYARQGGQIHGVFPVNVPYLIEAFPSWPAEQAYAILPGSDGGKVVLFRSQSWRGVDGRDDFHPTPQQLADRLAALPTGTVTWVYMTSDGGLTLENSYFELIGLLAPHVELVSTDAAAGLAVAAGGG